MRTWVLLGVACCAAHAVGQTAGLVMRGGEAAPEGTVLSVSLSGVEVRAGDQVRVLGLDRVRDVPPEMQKDWHDLRELATDAWRARTRLERGDVLGAEPLLEMLFARTEGMAGPTPAMVASGLLRCRLTRGAQAASVRPWLAMLASGQSEVTFSTAVEARQPIVDPSTGLVPELPPLWVAAPALRVALSGDAAPAPLDAASGVSASAQRAARLLGLYQASVRRALGEATDQGVGDRPGDDPGLQLVWDVVAADVGTAQQQAEALGYLAQRLDVLGKARASGDGSRAASGQSAEFDRTPTWQEAWCRVALGRAKTRSADAKERMDGIVMLLHVPARLRDVSPYLAGVALADAHEALLAQGDARGAASVRRELREAFAGHPALAAAQVRANQSQTQTSDPAAPRSQGGKP